MEVLGVYWDDVHRILFTKTVGSSDGKPYIAIEEDSLANLPPFGGRYERKPIHIDTLTTPDNITATLLDLANAMRSHGIYDEQLRYKETVKLLLARYCDENDARESKTGELKLQVLPGADRDFRSRVNAVYEIASRRYHRSQTLFKPSPVSELSDETLRAVVSAIQGIHLSSASNDAMQEVFMSFVPAVFKSSLDQYFTPVTLVDALVEMVSIGPNDRVVDPAMGTADFLTSAMSYRVRLGDKDPHQRIHGMDTDSQAYELAIINMILNHDGQANLRKGDSIEQASLWKGEMDVVLCNPPFGSKTIENRWDVLRQYELGHRWSQCEDGRWRNEGSIRESQQLGLLFIERSLKLLCPGGRVAIIVPEGYLCNPTYGYVRQWLLDNARILALVELPRRIFARSDVDLRSNIIVATKTAEGALADLQNSDYPIYADLIRKVGYKMGAGYGPIPKRDDATGLEIRDEDNEIILDSDFPKMLNGFRAFRRLDESGVHRDKWAGASLADILDHPLLDMKPRRLLPKALANFRSIRESGSYCKLGDVADVLQDKIDVIEEFGTGAMVSLVEGQDIRAVEGVTLCQQSERAWRVAARKTRKMYSIRPHDIVVGLVRPERRNIGLLLAEDVDNHLLGAPDGVAIVRAKEGYSQLWLFAALRSEACRIQFWTESGGTSYGKLGLDQLRQTLIPLVTPLERGRIQDQIQSWADAFMRTLELWKLSGSDRDRKAIVNSPAFGLETDWSEILMFDEDDP